MKIYRHTKQFGFSLIELGIVVVILGIVSAMVVPKHLDIASNSLSAAKLHAAIQVKSAYSITFMEQGRNPTLSELATNVQYGSANVSGVGISIDDTTYTVRTYTNNACSTATTANSNIVKCVGTIA